MKIKKYNEDFEEHWEDEEDPVFKFRQTEKPKKDELYLQLNFAGGDADTEHPEYHKFNFKFSEYKDNLGEINRMIQNYKTLKRVLDINNRDYCREYNHVLDRFGSDVARLYDYTPNDPQGDYQFKCYLSSIKLIGYDEEGNKHEAYV